MHRNTLAALVVASACASINVSAQSATPAAAPPAATAVYVRPAPPGELVDIGGRKIHVECTGRPGGPTVVIEAGLSQYTAHSTYGKAQDLIAAFAHVCTYDRAGLGWSDPVQGVRTHDDMVADLEKLLAAKRVTGPIVLVGHSIGGLLVRLYAQRHASSVTAVVLLDATPEATLFAPGAAESRQAMVSKIAAGLGVAKPGVPVVAMPAGTAPEVMLAFTPEVLAAVKQEYEAIDRIPEALRGPKGFGTLGDVPLTVIRRGRTASPPNADDDNWRVMQEALTKLSTRSVLVVAQQSGHVIPYDAPQVVADAVRSAIERR